MLLQFCSTEPSSCLRRKICSHTNDCLCSFKITKPMMQWKRSAVFEVKNWPYWMSWCATRVYWNINYILYENPLLQCRKWNCKAIFFPVGFDGPGYYKCETDRIKTSLGLSPMSHIVYWFIFPDLSCIGLYLLAYLDLLERSSLQVNLLSAQSYPPSPTPLPRE